MRRVMGNCLRSGQERSPVGSEEGLAGAALKEGLE